MPTLNEEMKKNLVDHGLFPEMADEVMVAVRSAPENKAMLGRWDDQIEGYPPPMVNVVWNTTKMHAIEWTEKNLPKAWFLNLLKGTVPEPLIIGGTE